MHILNKCSLLNQFSQVKFYSKFSNSNLISLLENMPKSHKHIIEAQNQRIKVRERLGKYVPSRISLQVLGTGAEGAPRSLYVFSDQSRYLFNCGEGTQRLAHEHKMKLAKLEHIFITQNSWQNIGGLPGTALTIQDVGVPSITLHGPKGLEEIFHATKRFVILRDLKIRMADCGEKNYFSDNVMTVFYIPVKRRPKTPEKDDTSETKAVQVGDCTNKTQKNLCDGSPLDKIAKPSSAPTTPTKRRTSPQRPSSSTSESEDIDNIDYYAYERKGSKAESPPERRKPISFPAQDPAAKLAALKSNKDLGICINYVCKLQPRPGALNLEKCVQFGVPTGPLLGKLKSGEDVVLPSGSVVKAKDVCEPDDPGPVFLVVDCPSEDYLDAFVGTNAFKRYQANINTHNDDLPYLIVHFTPQHILEDPRYRAWVQKFSPSTHHLVLNDFNTCMGSIAVHRAQHKLNLLYDKIFPILGDTGTKYDTSTQEIPEAKRIKCDGHISPKASSNVLQKVGNTLDKSKIFTYANTFCNFHLRPRTGLDRASELSLNPKEYILEPFCEEGFRETLEALQKQIKEHNRFLRVAPYPNILFLGTGSCIPNKTRNTSGILLQANEKTNIILDCGEGTYGQLVRFFGPEKVEPILANIKAIFISHLHADHHIGLIGLLQGRSRALQKLGRYNAWPVLLLAPKQISTWLNFYDNSFEDISDEFEIIPNSDLLFREHTLYEGTQVRLYETLDMADISTAYVRHCANSFGVSFRHKSGFKICYSGDTMPCEDLINIGLNCDLLIHEATMEDELEQEAITKMHSTTSQAIEIGNNMFAKYILLTHFSQRYAKLPRFNDKFTSNIGIAFDNMQVCLDELPLLPMLNPALQMMFAEHCEELESKALKRQLKLDRRAEAEKSA